MAFMIFGYFYLYLDVINMLERFNQHFEGCLYAYNNQMINLRQLNIFQLYRRLPFIIYKNKYLIPQRPYTTNSSKSISQSVNEAIPIDKITQPTKNELKSIDSEYLTTEDSLSSFENMNELAHDQSLSQYLTAYIFPSKTCKVGFALRSYIQENKDKLICRFNETLPNKTFKNFALNQFSKLSNEEKEKYQNLAFSIKYRYFKRFSLYQSLFKIPQKKYVHPRVLFEKQLPNKLKKRVKFSDLKTNQKKKFKQISNKLLQQDKLALSQFLKEFNLSIPHFSVIKEICQRTIKCSQLCKKYISNQKPKLKKLQSSKDIIDMQTKIIKNNLLQQFKKSQQFISTVSEEELKIYEELFMINPQPIVQPKKEKMIQLEKELELEFQKFKQENFRHKGNITTKEWAKMQQEIKQTKVEERQQLKVQAKPSKLNKQMDDAKQAKPSSSKNTKQQLELEIPSFNNSGDLQDLAFQLKDENLDDLNILDEDYEVLKLQRLIAKSGKAKIPAKKLKY